MLAQWIVVGVIEVLAVAYLVRRFMPRRLGRPAARPDVKASALVRKKKRPPAGEGEGARDCCS